MEACIAAFGRLDLLVNNVGSSFSGGAEEMAEADWEQQIDLNLRSAFLACKFALPYLKRQATGAIVTCPRSPACG